MSNVKINMFIFVSKLVQTQLNFIRRMDEKEYSKKLNNKLVRYSNDSKLSDQRMVRFYLRNTGLITEIFKISSKVFKRHL